MNCFRFANAMNNITIINPFNSGNSNITNVKILSNHNNHYRQNLEIQTHDEKPLVTNHTLFAVVTFDRINSCTFIGSTAFNKTHLSKTNFHKIKKDCHQDNLSFACLSTIL